MRRNVSVRVSLASMLTASLFVACTSAGPSRVTRATTAPPVTEAPTLQVGDEWRYNDGVVSRVVRSRSGAPAIRLGYGIPLMNFPLHLGKRWTWTQDLGSLWVGPPGFKEARQIRHEHTYEVVAFEEVKTPAGTFAAYRIRWTQENRGAYRWAGYMTLWYSPEVRAVVKRTVLTAEFRIPDLELHGYTLMEAKVTEQALRVKGLVPETQKELEARFARLVKLRFDHHVAGWATATFTPDSVVVIAGPGRSATGTWRITEGQLCTQFAMLRNGEKACFRSYRTGPKESASFRPDGSLNSTATEID